MLEKHEIKGIESIKEELFDLLLLYINLILNDGVISDNERFNIEILKRYFKIEEGDFFTKRYNELKYVLDRQFARIYSDNKVDNEEAIHSVELQALFDLSYDQFDQLKESEVRKSIKLGADITDLDTVRVPTSDIPPSGTSSDHIPQRVKDQVWNRDGGKCTECGSNERLTFGRIIPLTKGGTNTYRNIRLLCEACNTRTT